MLPRGGRYVGPGGAQYALETREGLYVVSLLATIAISALVGLVIWLSVSKASTDSLPGQPTPVPFAWTEDPGNPIYNPYPFPLTSDEDYFPWVVFDELGFDNGVLSAGPKNFYRMYHQGTSVTARDTRPH
jgi:hypothetical protein